MTIDGEEIWECEGVEYGPDPCAGEFNPPTIPIDSGGDAQDYEKDIINVSGPCSKVTITTERSWIEIPKKCRRPGPFEGYKMDTLVPWCVLRNAVSTPNAPWCAEDELVNDENNEGTPDKLYFKADWPKNWSFFVRGHIAIVKMKKRNAPGDNQEADPYGGDSSLYHQCIQNPPFVVYADGILKGQGEATTRWDFFESPGWVSTGNAPNARTGNPDFPFSRAQIHQNFTKTYWENHFEKKVFYPIDSDGRLGQSLRRTRRRTRNNGQ